MLRTHDKTGLSGDDAAQKPKRFLPLSPSDPGQSCPHPCPEHCPQEDAAGSEALGEPITVQEVAKLIGVSVWTVRQKLLCQGLPHFRTEDSGKLIFYREQVIRWVLSQQHEERRSLK